ncbi:hypothetical protein C7T94_17650 [Pedobacter yulinensis]|uniref:Uncharacterized protein n=1 Tax=Pedobacter yulinensis TaxID=2126353 RepID=A0A2T3HI03_9SPHI|nr:hypothetical protein C7T94_17650 [Pedobacter yulinensis]
MQGSNEVANDQGGEPARNRLVQGYPGLFPPPSDFECVYARRDTQPPAFCFFLARKRSSLRGNERLESLWKQEPPLAVIPGFVPQHNKLSTPYSGIPPRCAGVRDDGLVGWGRVACRVLMDQGLRNKEQRPERLSLRRAEAVSDDSTILESFLTAFDRCEAALYLLAAEKNAKSCRALTRLRTTKAGNQPGIDWCKGIRAFSRCPQTLNAFMQEEIHSRPPFASFWRGKEVASAAMSG